MLNGSKPNMAVRPMTTRAIRRCSSRFASDIFFSDSYPEPKADIASDSLNYLHLNADRWPAARQD